MQEGKIVKKPLLRSGELTEQGGYDDRKCMDKGSF
jgi:hypothetical protein